MQKWIVIPENTPSVERNCSKCGEGSAFVSSGKFRVNANGNKVDIWLIYRCERCNSTWNMEIASRVAPRSVGKERLERYSRNDAELALQCAFDAGILGRNKAQPCWDAIGYRIVKEEVNGPSDWVELLFPYALGIRLDRILCEGTGVSRSKIKALLEVGEISGIEEPVSPKTKCKGRLRLKGVPDETTK